MSNNTNHSDPSKRDRLKPVELVGFSAVLAVFAAAVVALATDDFAFLVPVTGIAVFIVTLMVLALLGLSMKPNPEDLLMRENAAEIARRAEQNEPAESVTKTDPEAENGNTAA